MFCWRCGAYKADEGLENRGKQVWKGLGGERVIEREAKESKSEKEWSKGWGERESKVGISGVEREMVRKKDESMWEKEKGGEWRRKGRKRRKQIREKKVGKKASEEKEKGEGEREKNRKKRKRKKKRERGLVRKRWSEEKERGRKRERKWGKKNMEEKTNGEGKQPLYILSPSTSLSFSYRTGERYWCHTVSEFPQILFCGSQILTCVTFWDSSSSYRAILLETPPLFFHSLTTFLETPAFSVYSLDRVLEMPIPNLCGQISTTPRNNLNI